MIKERKFTLISHHQNVFLRFGTYLSEKIKSSTFWSTVTTCALISMIAMMGIILIAQLTGASLRSLTIDPADFELRPAYIGMLSHFGLMLWAGSASICFFSAIVLLKTSEKEAYRFLFASGILSTVFLFDDALLLHDRVFPSLLNIPEPFIYLGYLILILGYFFKFIHTIRITEYRLFFISGLLLCISVLMDSILPVTSIETFFEDGLKFTGIIFWSAYFGATAISWLSSRILID
jgi:hypothetical protein